MERKKIMFFIYRMGGGGAARTMLNIVNHLDREKFSPILVTLDFNYTYENYLRDDVRFIKLPVKRLRESIIPLAKLLKQEKPDLLFSTVSTYNIIAILATILSRTKTKLIIREAAYLGGNVKENIKLKIYGLLYRMADRVIALSEGVKENLISRYGVDEEAIDVIYNPVDLKHIEAEGEREIEETNLFTDRKTILTAGRLVVEKDHATLLRAFKKSIQLESSHLIILGEGELEEELKKLAESLGIEDRVSFVGFKKNPYAYMKRADVFALTSRTEGFGHVLVEALTLGVPIVSTRCNPGAEEILGEETYGMLAEVGDDTGFAQKLDRALSLTAEEREAIIAKGKARAQQFSAEQIVRQYEARFCDVLRGKNE